MAEAIAALGLASNIVQFISFAGELIDRTSEISRHGGALVKYTELETITLSLKEFTNRITPDESQMFLSSTTLVNQDSKDPETPALKIAQTSSTLRKDDDPSEAHRTTIIELDCQLREVSKGCNKAASELINAVSKLKQCGRSKTWDTFKLALRSIWEEDKIKELSNHLDKYRSQIGMIMGALATEQARLDSATLADSISQLEVSNQRSLESLLEKIRRHINELQGASDGNFVLARVSETAQKQREETIRKQMLVQLNFGDMRKRYSKIEPPHPGTFRWVFHDNEGQYVEEATGVDRGTNFDGIEPEYGHNTLSLWGPQAEKRDIQKWDSYREWLNSDMPLYWITGKPGSGKSTLMRHLYDHPDLEEYLQTWAGEYTLCKAAFFFSNLEANIMQMSKEGLLRALLYEAIKDRTNLLPELFPERWSYHTLFGRDSREYSLSELEYAFKTLIMDTCFRYFFIIDGLDELDASEDQSLGDPKKLAEFLLYCCTESRNVKICVASRPWIEFESVFTQRPTLNMETLTPQDIERYVKGTFQNNIAFNQRWIVDPKGAENLIKRLIERAEGVFLWVRLVTNLLIEGLENGDTTEELQRLLNDCPQRLQNLFETIWAQIKHRKHSKYTCKTIRLLQVSGEQIPLLVLFYAEQGPAGALSDDTCVLPRTQAYSLADQMRRRLNGRCRNLIEAPTFFKEEAWAKVEFLHETVKDFLSSGTIASSIAENCNDSTQYLTLALVAGCVRCIKKMDGSDPRFLRRFAWLSSHCLFLFQKLQEYGEETNVRLLIDLDEAASVLVQQNPEGDPPWTKTIQRRVPRAKPHWTNATDMWTGSSTFFEFAYQKGFHSYLEQALRKGIPNDGAGSFQRDLLIKAVDNEKIPLKCVSIILNHGANVNLPKDKDSPRTPWYLLLLKLTGVEDDARELEDRRPHINDTDKLKRADEEDQRLRKRLGSFAEMLLHHGADPYIKVRNRDVKEIIGPIVKKVDPELAGRLVSKLESLRRQNPQKLSKRLRNGMKRFTSRR